MIECHLRGVCVVGMHGAIKLDNLFVRDAVHYLVVMFEIVHWVDSNSDINVISSVDQKIFFHKNDAVNVPKTIHSTPAYTPPPPKSELLFVGLPTILSAAMITHAEFGFFHYLNWRGNEWHSPKKWLQLAPSRRRLFFTDNWFFCSVVDTQWTSLTI